LELDPGTAAGVGTDYARVVEILSKSEIKSRPRKRKTLSGFIASLFQNKIDPKNIDRIIDMLFKNKKISESNNTLVYLF
jgi:hypothetical protein